MDGKHEKHQRLIPTDEERMMARHTRALIDEGQP